MLNVPVDRSRGQARRTVLIEELKMLPVPRCFEDPAASDEARKSELPSRRLKGLLNAKQRKQFQENIFAARDKRMLLNGASDGRPVKPRNEPLIQTKDVQCRLVTTS